VREKGYAEVFDAASRLRDHVPHVRFAVIGDDDHAKDDALDARDRARAAAAGVRFLGGRDDVARLYAGMDIYVLASHREGFPRSAMEATAMGVPVVATDIRGCRQVVDQGITGLLVPARDATALAAAIRSLAADPELRTRLGTAGRAKATREFDERRCFTITLDTYRMLLERRALPVPALPS
jgi:glycosyltransferase involved in cell wall biosynthesis